MVSAWSSTESGLDGRTRSAARPEDGKITILNNLCTYPIIIIIIETAQELGDTNDDVGKEI